ncbi:hypothetical protein GCM10023339_74370 [Alloalcanivorax gelatiniphagus]
MNQTPLEDQVHDALHRTADPLHRSPLTVTDVRTRAHRIQRRRSIAAGAAVAAVLAIAVPVGATMVGDGRRSDVPPATQPPSPEITGTVRIDPRSAQVVEELALPVINVNVPSLIVGGETVTLPHDYSQLTPYLDGWTGLAEADTAQGWLKTVHVLDAEMRVVDEFTQATELAVSPDAGRLAWAWYDGTRWVVVDRAADGSREERQLPMPPGPQEETLQAVGFLPDDGIVLARTDPATGRHALLAMTPEGRTTTLPGFIRAGATDAAGGLVSGQTSFSGDGSCWKVVDATAGGAGATVWKTCDYSLLAFSPDGEHVVGLTDYLTQDGSPTLAVLDAATGDPVIDFELAGSRTEVVGINPEILWEDVDTLVTTAATGGRQYVVRLGLDGSVERIDIDSPGLEPGDIALKLAAATS